MSYYYNDDPLDNSSSEWSDSSSELSPFTPQPYVPPMYDQGMRSTTRFPQTYTVMEPLKFKAPLYKPSVLSISTKRTGVQPYIKKFKEIAEKYKQVDSEVETVNIQELYDTFNRAMIEIIQAYNIMIQAVNNNPELGMNIQLFDPYVPIPLDTYDIPVIPELHQLLDTMENKVNEFYGAFDRLEHAIM